MHPLFSLLVRRPELVLDHLVGYASLVREETSSAGRALARRAIAWGVALAALLLFLGLAGVATMLGVMQGAFHWALVLVPGAALAVALAALMVARQVPQERAFSDLQTQLDADAQALRAMGARA